MDDIAVVVAQVQVALRDRDRETLRLLLHPYLHWTLPDGTVLRGRRNVLAMLEAAPPSDVAQEAPADVELRDGQIYRWRDPLSG